MTDTRPSSVPARRPPSVATGPVSEAYRVTPGPTTVSTRMHDRLVEKQTANRRRTRRRWITRLGVLGAVALAVWAIAASPLFVVKADRVEVEGIGGYVSSADVTAATEATVGQSLVWLDVAQVEDSIRQIPAVRDAHVVRVWPDGLLVTVTARLPVAAIPSGSESFALVDEQGMTITTVSEVPAQVPVIQAPIGADNVRIHEAVLAVLYEMPAALRGDVESMSADTQDSVTVVLDGGLVVEWGSAADSALKAEVLMIMLESPQVRGATVIDVSAPTLPVTRFEAE